MNRTNDEEQAALAAQSNLTATAGEFYPRGYDASGSRNNPNHSVSERSKEFYSRNREPKHSKSSPGRFKKTEREFVKPPPPDGRLWRDNKKEDHRKDSWYQNEYQAYSSRGHFQDRRQLNGFRDRAGSSRDSFDRENRGNRYQPRRKNAEEGPSNPEEVNGLHDKDFEAGRRVPNDYFPKNYRKSTEKDERRNEVSRGYSDKGRNQMEVLIAQLTKGTLECLVCCEEIRQNQSTWSCRVCHHVLHLRCVTKWAHTSKLEQGWHCPACRCITLDIPSHYLCFCGKMENPPWNRSDCPHTCGSLCGLSRPAPCPHRCTLPCHPGACPTCHLYVTRACGCGRVSKTVPCSDTVPVVCEAVCDKPLNCGIHTCSSTCHGGDCSRCDQIIKLGCYCGKTLKEVPCSSESVGITSFACDAVCEKKLACGNHECKQNCHEGSCLPCALLPENAQYCPCGKKKVFELSVNPRTNCLDPIPTCGSVCGKLLPCGKPGFRHECKSSCHVGPCPPCPLETSVRCRCGHMTKVINCSELSVRADDARCEKKCNKNRSCGKHKCREPCCIDVDHICPLPCNRTLSCGLHRCEASCHTGYCRPCPRDSYQELSCECGAEVIFPPVPCGTRRPRCLRPCSRSHPCDHPPTHNCHDDPSCPPCTVLVSKHCYGGHELRKAVFCHLEGFSCGIACGKPLPCGRHTCNQPCHEGECLQPGQACSQPCLIVRQGCGHGCGAPCHEPPCIESPCKEMVRVTCECGIRFGTRSCVDHAKDYQRIATAQLASKMADLAAGGSIDITNITGSNKKISFKTLECNDECKLVERNRRLAVGLQIRNPDLSSKLTPRYSDFLRQWAKKDPHFCQNVHDKLTDLVQLAKQSKQKSRSYSFESMNREKRQFIHDYCEHFGCESVAYDQEPNRNVVATAIRDKSWLPGYSLLEVIQRESGARKVPVPSNFKLTPNMRSMEVLPIKVPGSSGWGTPSVERTQEPSTSTGAERPVVDYFDMTLS